MIRTSLLMVSLLALLVAPAHAADWTLGGDFRAMWLSVENRARDGSVTDRDDFRARLRVGLRGGLSDSVSVSVRAAALLSSDQDGLDVYLRGYAPSPTGAGLGDVTLDELSVRVAPPGADWSLRMGRFQAVFALDDLMRKSLDHNDSPNVDITWTDGVHFVHGGLPGWDAHLILQHNHRNGPTNTMRPPLSFDDASRVTVYTAIAARDDLGPVVQRTIGLTWIGDALPGGEDYLALTVKTAAAWQLGDTGRRLVLAGEAGKAFETPPGADGFAWHASVNMDDILPAHRAGIVYGRVPAGWLLSSDFRENDTLLEFRWLWRLKPALSLDARWRRREEITVPAGAPRRTDDIYMRTTFRF